MLSFVNKNQGMCNEQTFFILEGQITRSWSTAPPSTSSRPYMFLPFLSLATPEGRILAPATHFLVMRGSTRSKINTIAWKTLLQNQVPLDRRAQRNYFQNHLLLVFDGLWGTSILFPLIKLALRHLFWNITVLCEDNPSCDGWSWNIRCKLSRCFGAHYQAQWEGYYIKYGSFSFCISKTLRVKHKLVISFEHWSDHVRHKWDVWETVHSLYSVNFWAEAGSGMTFNHFSYP